MREVLEQVARTHTARARRGTTPGSISPAPFVRAAFSDGLARDCRRIDLGRPPRRLLGIARAALVRGDDERGRIGHPLLDASPVDDATASSDTALVKKP